MILALNPSHEREAVRVVALQRVSYAVEAALIGTFDIPPLREMMHDLACCGETFYGYFAAGELVGVVSRKMETGVVDVHQLVVHPEHFRKGIAGSLLKHIEDTEAYLSSIVVSTGSKNPPPGACTRAWGSRRSGRARWREDCASPSSRRSCATTLFTGSGRDPRAG